MYIRHALTYGKKLLSESSQTSFLDSLLLLQKVSGMSKERILVSDEILSDAMLEDFNLLLEKRRNNMPVQYIISRAEFMGLDFYVDENVLIPRCDTEILVEEVIRYARDKGNLNVYDLCTGSGCIAVSLKKFCPHLNVVGVDISPRAIDIAKTNARQNDVEVEFVCDDIFEKFMCGIPSDFDIIVANPPYIPTDFIDKLDENVKGFEPVMALDGGKDGLDFYRFIAEKAKCAVKIFFEIGKDQADAVSGILSENKFGKICVIKDLAGLDRVITAQKDRRS